MAKVQDVSIRKAKQRDQKHLKIDLQSQSVVFQRMFKKASKDGKPNCPDSYDGTDADFLADPFAYLINCWVKGSFSYALLPESVKATFIANGIIDALNTFAIKTMQEVHVREGIPLNESLPARERVLDLGELTVAAINGYIDYGTPTKPTDTNAVDEFIISASRQYNIPIGWLLELTDETGTMVENMLTITANLERLKSEAKEQRNGKNAANKGEILEPVTK